MKLKLIICAALLLTIRLAFALEKASPRDGEQTSPSWIGPPAAHGNGSSVPAEAEASGVTTPVRLTLRLYKKKIKAGEPLWYQLRIQNVGKEEMLLVDRLLDDPWELAENIWTRYGIYLEVIRPDGKPLEMPPARFRYKEPSFEERGVSGLLEIEGPKEQAMVDGWKKQGLSQYEINSRLLEYNTKKRRDAEATERTPSIKLKPGERVESKSWFYYNDWERIKKKPLPHPIGDFSKLEFFEFDKPGKYKIRAVYDYRPSEIWKKMFGSKKRPFPGSVLIRTPWITVTVLP